MFIDTVSFFVNSLFSFRSLFLDFIIHCDLILPYIIISYFFCNIVFPVVLTFKDYFKLYNS